MLRHNEATEKPYPVPLSSIIQTGQTIRFIKDSDFTIRCLFPGMLYARWNKTVDI